MVPLYLTKTRLNLEQLLDCKLPIVPNVFLCVVMTNDQELPTNGIDGLYNILDKTTWSNGQGSQFIKRSRFNSVRGYAKNSLLEKM